MNVLLVDTFITDYEIFSTSCNQNTICVPYSINTTRIELLNSLNENQQTITRLALAFHYSKHYTFLENEDIFSENNKQFLINIIKNYNIQRIDFLACNTLQDNQWKTFYDNIVSETNVVLGASNNDSGNIQYGGDWIMENTSEDIQSVYFNDNILYYKYLLGRSDIWMSFITNNNLYFSGNNYAGQGGSTTGLPIKINNTTGKVIADFKTELDSTLYLMTDGTIYGVGSNLKGQLGLGATVSVDSLTVVPLPAGKVASKIIRSKANTASFVLMTDGTLYATGLNDSSQLGLGDFTNRNTFTAVTLPDEKSLSQLVAGYEFTTLLMTDGTMYSIGRNSIGQLGVGDYTNRSNFTSVSLPVGKTPSNITAGLAHVVVIMTDGSLYAFGMGFGTSLTQITLPTGKSPSQVDCGGYQTIVLMTDGTVYGIGNGSGELGVGDTVARNSLTLMPLPAGKTALKVYASKNYNNAYTIVLMTDNTIYVAGNNSDGQLGNGTTTSSLFLTEITNLPKNKTWSMIDACQVHTLVLANDGNAYHFGSTIVWGYLPNNGWGIINVTGYQPTYIFQKVKSIRGDTLSQLITNTTGKSLSQFIRGGAHQFALMTDGTLYSIGRNDGGQLGIGNTTNQSAFTQVTVPAGKTVSKIDCGHQHTIILMTDGTIYATGLNYYGQLGLGDNTNRNVLTLITNMPAGKTPVTILCGANHTAVLMTDGTIYVCGSNERGQLGTGNNTWQNVLTLMTNSTGKTPSQIYCGSDQVYVLMTDKTIYGTGWNNIGQLGIGNTTDKTTLTAMTIPAGKTVSNMYCGQYHSIVSMTDGTIYGTGTNDSGQLGLGHNTNRTSLTAISVPAGKTISNINATGSGTYLEMTDGTIYAAGLNNSGQLGVGDFVNRNVFTQSIFEKSDPTITNFTISSKNFGDASFNIVDPSSNSSGSFSYSSSNTSVATISGNTITIVGFGSTTIAATQAETIAFESGSITTIFTVNKTVASQLKALGYTAAQLRTSNYVASDLKDAYTATEMKAADFTASEIKEGGYTASEARIGGYSVEELVNGNYLKSDIIAAGYNAIDLKQYGYLAIDLRSDYSASQLRDASYTLENLVDASFNATELKSALYTASDLKGVNFTASQLKDASYTLENLVDASFNASELKVALYSAIDLKGVNFTASQLKDASYTLQNLVDASFNASELKAALYTASDLKNFFSGNELKNVGYTASEMREAAFTATNLRNLQYTIQEIREGGYTANQMRGAGYNVSDLFSVSFTENDILSSVGNIDFTSSDLRLWLDASDPSANGIRPTSNAQFSQWLDKSIYKNNTIGCVDEYNNPATITNTLTGFNNYYPSFLFPGGYRYLYGDFSNSSRINGETTTMFIVGNLNTGGNVCWVSFTQHGGGGGHTSTTSWLMRNEGYATRLGSSNVTYFGPGLAGLSNSNNLYRHQFTGTRKISKFLAKNNSYNGFETNSAGQFDINRFTIGANSSGWSGGYTHFAGNICEILYFNNSLSSSEIETVEGYLAWKWGLVNLLKDDHPYKNAIPISEFADAGYSLIQLKKIYDINAIASLNIYSATEMKNAGYSATELKNAGYSATELKNAGFSASEMKSAGYSVSQLINVTVGYTGTELRNGGFTATEMKAANYNATDLKSFGYITSELKTAAFTAKELKDAGYEGIDIKSGGYSAIEMKSAPYDAGELKTFGFTAIQLKVALFTATELKNVGFTGSELKTAGYTASEMKAANFLASQLKSLGYSILDIKLSGFTVTQLLSDSFTQQEIESVPSLVNNIPAREFKDASYSMVQIKALGYPVSILKLENFAANDIFNAGYTASEARIGGYTVVELRGNYSDGNIISAGYNASFLLPYYTAGELVNYYSAQELLDAGYTIIQLKQGSYTASQLRNAGFTVNQLKFYLFTDTEILNAGYTSSELKASALYTAKQLKDSNNYSLLQIKEGGYSPANLLSAGFAKNDIVVSGYSASELRNSNFKVEDLRLGGFVIQQLMNIYFTSEIFAGGFTPNQLYLAGYSIEQFISNNSSKETILSAGFPASTLFTKTLYTVLDLKTYNYTALQIRTAGYSDNNILSANFTAAELNVAKFTASQLKSRNYSAQQLLLGNYPRSEILSLDYDITELKAAGFTSTELRIGGYTIAQLKAANYTDAEILSAGYSATLLKQSNYLASNLFENNYSIPDLKIANYLPGDIINAGYSAALLRNNGYTSQQLKNNNFTVNQLITGGYSDNEILSIGYSASELKDNNYTAQILKSYNYKPLDLKNSGYSDSDILSAQFLASDLKLAGYLAQQLRQNNYSVSDLITAVYNTSSILGAGYEASALVNFYTARQLRENKYSVENLRSGGYSTSDILAAGFPANVLLPYYSVAQLKNNGYTPLQLKNGGFSDVNILAASFTTSSLRNANYTASQLREYEYTISDLILGGYSRVQILEGGFPSSELKLSTLNFTASELRIKGYSIQNLIDGNYSNDEILIAGYSATDLKQMNYLASELYSNNYNALQLKTAGYNDYDIINLGYNIEQLKNAGYLPIDLQNNYTDTEILSGGFTATSLKDANYSVNNLKEYNYSVQQLKIAGYTDDDILSAGYTAFELKQNGYNALELNNNNYTSVELKESGYTITELEDGGYSTEEILFANYTASQLLAEGYSSVELKSGFYSALSLKIGGYPDSDILSIGYTVKDLTIAGYTVDQLREYGYTDGVILTGISNTIETLPNPPVITNITTNNSRALVYFTDLSNLEVPIIGYKYTLNNGINQFWTINNNSPLQILGLTNGESYDIGIYAVNRNGTSTISNIFEGIIPSDVPNKSLITNGQSSNGIISFNYIIDNINGSNITEYYYSINDIDYILTESSGNQININSLETNKLYNITMKTKNAKGFSEKSNTLTIKNIGSLVSPIITDVSYNNNMGYVYYTIDSSINKIFYKYSLNNGDYYYFKNQDNPLLLHNLELNDTYNIKIKAEHFIYGESDESNSITFTTISKPSKPTILSTNYFNGLITLNIIPSLNNGSTISKYYYSLNNESYLEIDNIEGSEITIARVINININNSIKIRSENNIGISEESNSTLFTYKILPDKPTINNIIAGDTTCIVNYTDGNTYNSPILCYKYKLSNDSKIYIAKDVTNPLTISGLTNGVSYSIKIKTVCQTGESDYSNVSEIFSPFGVPTSPIITKIEPRINSLLVYFEQGNTGGLEILGYKYSVNTGNLMDANEIESPLLITGLVNKINFSITIYAFNSQGLSLQSNTLTCTPGVPTAPVINSIIPSANTFTIHYTQSETTNGSPISKMFYTFDGINLNSFRSITNPLVIEKITNGVFYDIKILSSNLNGFSPLSNNITSIVNVPPDILVINKVSLFIESSTTCYAVVDIKLPNDNGSPIITYKYALGFSNNYIDLSNNSLPIIIPNLPANTTLSIKLKATNLYGDSKPSLPSKNVKFTLLVPSTPSIKKITTSLNSMSVSFKPPLNNGSDIITYKYSLNNGPYIDTSSTEIPLSIPIENNLAYNIQVIAVNIVGDSLPSKPLSKLVSFVYLPPLPPRITGITGSNQSLIVNFTPSKIRGAPVTNYSYSLDSGETIIDAETTSSPLTITGLTNNLKYSVILYANSSVGMSIGSNTSIGSPIYSIPGTPVINSITPLNNSCYVVLRPPIINGSPIITYLYSLDDGNSLIDTNNSEGPFLITGLTNGTIYNIQFVAVNDVGNSPVSLPKSVIPIYEVPGAPVIKTARPGTKRISITFIPSIPNGAPILAYYYSFNNGITFTNANVLQGTTSFTINDLTSLSTYTVRIYAENELGKSIASNALTVTVF